MNLKEAEHLLRAAQHDEAVARKVYQESRYLWLGAKRRVQGAKTRLRYITGEQVRTA